MDRQRKFTLMGAVLIAAVALLTRGKAIAQAAPEAAASLPAAERSVRAFLERETRALANTFPGRIELVVGSLGERASLAPCGQVEPFMPPGARLWGRSNIGLRCREGASWSVYLPIEVKIYGPALVATRPLAPGQSVGDDDLRVEEIELTREAPGVATDPANVAGKVLARAVAPGTPLRAEWLRPKPVIAQGDLVKVTYLGHGFTVAADGKAVSSAAEGQAVRVQMDSGRILTGTARDGRRVELR
jgi:flagellar basal body P-ring formation protein FlgA